MKLFALYFAFFAALSVRCGRLETSKIYQDPKVENKEKKETLTLLFKEITIDKDKIMALKGMDPQQMIDHIEKNYDVVVFPSEKIKVLSSKRKEEGYEKGVEFYLKYLEESKLSGMFIGAFAPLRTEEPKDRPFGDKGVIILGDTADHEGLLQCALVHEFMHYLITEKLGKPQKIDGKMLGTKASLLRDSLKQAGQFEEFEDAILKEGKKIVQDFEKSATDKTKSEEDVSKLKADTIKKLKDLNVEYVKQANKFLQAATAIAVNNFEEHDIQLLEPELFKDLGFNEKMRKTADIYRTRYMKFVATKNREITDDIARVARNLERKAKLLAAEDAKVVLEYEKILAEAGESLKKVDAFTKKLDRVLDFIEKEIDKQK